MPQIRMKTKENHRQILCLRSSSNLVVFPRSSWFLFVFVFFCFLISRLLVSYLCTGILIGWFMLYFRLTWCLSPPCNPTVGVANKAAGPSGEGNNLGSVRGNLSRQFKQGNIVRKSSPVTIVVRVLKVKMTLRSLWPRLGGIFV